MGMDQSVEKQQNIFVLFFHILYVCGICQIFKMCNLSSFVLTRSQCSLS